MTNKFTISFFFKPSIYARSQAEALEAAHSDAEMVLKSLGCTSEREGSSAGYGRCVRTIESRYIKTEEQMFEAFDCYVNSNRDKMLALIGTDVIRKIGTIEEP